MPRIPNRIVSDEEDDDNQMGDSSDVDSDEELQKQFAEGKLQTGLSAVVPFKKKMLINNEEGLKDKLIEIEKKLDWSETLHLINEPLDSPDLTAKYGDLSLKINRKGEVSADDKIDTAQHDFKREMLFYRQAQAAILDGIPKLHKFGIKTRRPDDYFAQMLKSDDHMKRVQEHLNSKREALEKSEQAKKLREMKKMGKKIQHEVLLNRQKEKKQLIDKVKAYKKGKLKDLDFIDDKKSNKGAGAAGGKNSKANGKKKENNKRANKNSIYGYGGQKKRSKKNTAESSAQYGTKKGKQKAQRPGKARRQTMRGRK